MNDAAVLWLMTPYAPELGDLLNRPEWHARAACRGMGVDAFFPERGQSTEAAKALCAACEVRAECLEAALGDVTTQGVWAGTSERGRRELRKAVA